MIGILQNNCHECVVYWQIFKWGGFHGDPFSLIQIQNVSVGQCNWKYGFLVFILVILVYLITWYHKSAWIPFSFVIYRSLKLYWKGTGIPSPIRLLATVISTIWPQYPQSRPLFIIKFIGFAILAACVELIKLFTVLEASPINLKIYVHFLRDTYLQWAVNYNVYFTATSSDVKLKQYRRWYWKE